jgi:para-aminobenzoate synthetase component 1
MTTLGHAATPDLGSAAQAVRAWPADRPLAVLTGGGGTWVMLAEPGPAVSAGTPGELEAALRSIPEGGNGLRSRPDRGPPLGAGAAVALPYHLGAALEPASLHAPAGAVGAVLPIRGVLGLDQTTGQWHATGDARDSRDSTRSSRGGACVEPAAFGVGPLTSDLGQRGYERIVRSGLEAIAAGDVYQVNLAHRLSAPFTGSTRAFFADLLERTGAVHGAYLEVPGEHGPTAVCSASPELFLRLDGATRRVSTRPMKGTRPITGDPEELRASDKDRAELNMITDLMRNDLGRVCAFGSVTVDAARTIEAHAASVWQATSTVSGTLRDGVTPADLIRATFPPGSVTGAPKIRAMQLIDELEPSERGFYCGSLGWLDSGGGMEMNVAIRTAVIVTLPDGSRELRYHAGAGIVADSEPGAEWAETLSKAGVIASTGTTTRPA